jgi:Bacterial RNA polymerase, alpha chain C terminal domain
MLIQTTNHFIYFMSLHNLHKTRLQFKYDPKLSTAGSPFDLKSAKEIVTDEIKSIDREPKTNIRDVIDTFQIISNKNGMGTAHCLLRAGIETLEDLAKLHDLDLLEIKGIGPKSLDIIKEIYALFLKGKITPPLVQEKNPTIVKILKMRGETESNVEINPKVRAITSTCIESTIMVNGYDYLKQNGKPLLYPNQFVEGTKESTLEIKSRIFRQFLTDTGVTLSSTQYQRLSPRIIAMVQSYYYEGKINHDLIFELDKKFTTNSENDMVYKTFITWYKGS